MNAPDDMFWIGTIQDLGRPYAELYLDKDGNHLFLFVRVSNLSDPQTKYAAISVTPKQVAYYMDSNRPMADVFSHLPFRFASIKNKKVTFEDTPHISSLSTFQFNVPFDPLLCVNKTKMKLAIKRMLNNKL